MMKNEFETLAGYEVTNDDYYKIIEPMYYASNLDKAEFVKTLDKKRFAVPTRRQMINRMKKIAEHLYETCERYTDWRAQEELRKLAHEYAERFYHLNWQKDIEAWVYLDTKYYYEEIGRGCTYPYKLCIGRGGTQYEQILLIK